MSPDSMKGGPRTKFVVPPLALPPSPPAGSPAVSGNTAEGSPLVPQSSSHSSAAANLLQSSKPAPPLAQSPPASPAGYLPEAELLQKQEFRRLQGRVYADYAGAAPYSEQLLSEVLRELSSSLHGNPHSEAGWGESRSAAADAARLLTLQACGADTEQYECIFTSGATGGVVSKKSLSIDITPKRWLREKSTAKCTRSSTSAFSLQAPQVGMFHLYQEALSVETNKGSCMLRWIN